MRVELESIVVVDAVDPAPGDDPLADLVPPAGLLGAILREMPLPVEEARRAPVLLALAALLARDGRTAGALLADLPRTPGVAVLRGAAALVRRELPAVHDAVYGLADDPALGPVARVLTGAALRADGSVREAVRDFEAASAARPDWWPPRLLAAEAYETDDLAFHDKAAEAYAAVVRAAPDQPAAVLGHAWYLASKDRPAARRLVEGLLARRDDLVGGWRLLAWVRGEGGTSEDVRAAAEAHERIAALRPDDPRAWGDLGLARWRWATAGGGSPALRAAADAFARQTELAPADGLAWLHRGAAVQEAAIETPVAGDAGPFRTRLLEARTCYGRALSASLRPQDAARAQFNVGLLLDFLPASTPAVRDVPASSLDAFAAAVAADASFVPASFALAAARVAAGDGAGADRALAAVTPTDAPELVRERAVLEAAAAHLRGDEPRARRLLAGPAQAPTDGELAPALARALLLAGYPRAAESIVATGDGPARVLLRARTRAALRDVEGTRAALERLRTLDAAAAADARARYPEIAGVLPAGEAAAPAPR